MIGRNKVCFFLLFCWSSGMICLLELHENAIRKLTFAICHHRRTFTKHMRRTLKFCSKVHRTIRLWLARELKIVPKFNKIPPKAEFPIISPHIHWIFVHKKTNLFESEMDAFNDSDVARAVDEKETATDGQCETEHIGSVHMVLLFSKKSQRCVYWLGRSRRDNNNNTRRRKKTLTHTKHTANLNHCCALCWSSHSFAG